MAVSQRWRDTIKHVKSMNTMSASEHFRLPDIPEIPPYTNPESVFADAERPLLEIDRVLGAIWTALPDAASSLVKQNLDMAQPFNRALAENPDDPREHAARWHQYGILTHSEKFRRALKEHAQVLVRDWGVADRVTLQQDEKISGTPKSDLLQVAALLHDVGKFTARTLKPKRSDGTLSRFYTGHEADSGAIIRFAFKDGLMSVGLDEQQVEYVAACAELHFELGKARRAASHTGYTMEFAGSEACTEAIRRIIAKHLGYAVEIGLMFIADNLSKTEVMATPGTDAEIEQQRPTLEAEIARRGLNPKLISQALAEPVNMAVARRYFEVWSSMQPPSALQNL